MAGVLMTGSGGGGVGALLTGLGVVDLLGFFALVTALLPWLEELLS